MPRPPNRFWWISGPTGADPVARSDRCSNRSPTSTPARSRSSRSTPRQTRSSHSSSRSAAFPPSNCSAAVAWWMNSSVPCRWRMCAPSSSRTCLGLPRANIRRRVTWPRSATSPRRLRSCAASAASDPANLDARRDLARYLALTGDVVGASQVLGQLPPQAQNDPASNAVRALIHFAALATDDAARTDSLRAGAARSILGGSPDAAVESLLARMQGDRAFATRAGRDDLLQAFALLARRRCASAGLAPPARGAAQLTNIGHSTAGDRQRGRFSPAVVLLSHRCRTRFVTVPGVRRHTAP